MKLGDHLRREWVIPDMRPASKRDVLEKLVACLAASGVLREARPVVAALCEREKLMSTGIGRGIAIPHAMIDQAATIYAAFARVAGGVDYAALDGEPVYLVFLLLAPREASGQHLKLLARLARLVKQDSLVAALREADTADRVLELIAKAEETV